MAGSRPDRRLLLAYRFTTRFTLTEHNGPIRVSVFDLGYRDNKAGFEVTLLRGQD